MKPIDKKKNETNDGEDIFELKKKSIALKSIIMKIELMNRWKENMPAKKVLLK